MESKANNPKMLKIIIVIEFAIILFLIINKFVTANKTEVLITQLEYSKTEKDSVTNELEKMLKEYDELETNNDTLNSKLSAEKKRIEELLEELKTVKSSNKYLIAQYKNEIETLRSIMRSYIVQIDSLYTKNTLLTEENTKIKNDYYNVIDEKKDLVNEKDSLKNQVSLAAVLKAQSIAFQALNDRDKPTTRISKTQKFEVCFNLSENSIAKTGTKYVYLRIMKPSGEVLRNSNSNLFSYNGNDIAYSSKKQVDYTGKLLNVCMYYTNSEELFQGKYSVYIFVDGNQIGDYSITLE